jgi:hypothetical protein
MSDIQQKRTYVEKLYSSPKWKKRVRAMEDAQVIAIYMRERNRPPTKKAKPKESEDDGIPF